MTIQVKEDNEDGALGPANPQKSPESHTSLADNKKISRPILKAPLDPYKSEIEEILIHDLIHKG
jgi:hypothetical protein